MKTISATLLRVQLRDLLADLDSGPVTITKHGKPVAVLSAPVEPVEAPEAPTPEANPSEAENALVSQPEAEETLRDVAAWTQENNVVTKDLETQARINSFDGNEEDEDEGDEWADDMDGDFEAWLSGRDKEPDIEIAF